MKKLYVLAAIAFCIAMLPQGAQAKRAKKADKEKVETTSQKKASKSTAEKTEETRAAVDRATKAAEAKKANESASVASSASESESKAAEENVEPIVLTIEQAVSYANENSRTLKSAQIDLELKERAKQYSWNVFVPEVNASATASRANFHNRGFNGEDEKWTVLGNLGVQVNLSLAYIGSIKKAYADYEAGVITWEQTQRQTEMNIRKLFYGYLLQQENLKISEASLENARQRAVQAGVNYRNGLVPELSMLDAQVTYENMRPDIEKARQELSQQLDTFAFLLGMPLGTKIVLKGKIEPRFVTLNADELYQKYGDNNPDVILIKKNIDIVDLGLSAINFRDYAPTLSVGWAGQPLFGLAPKSGVASGWGDFGSWSDGWMDNGGWNITLAWNLTNMLPFTDAGKDKKDLQSNKDKLAISLEEAMQNTEKEVKKNVDSLSQAQAAIESRTRNITLAQRSYDMASVAYRNGRMELLDLRDKEYSLNQAKLGLISEQYNYLTYLLDLEYLLNTNLGSKTE